jgi:hypothetical protein
MKGRCRWGLQAWSRQVGLVQGTRWPAGSSAGRMVARTVRRSRVRFLGWALKPRSSRDDVVAESWLEIGRRLHQVREFCSGSPQNYWVTWLSHKAKAEDSVWLSGQNEFDRLVKPVWPGWGRRAPRGFKTEEHVGTARLTSRLSEVRSPDIRLMVLRQIFLKLPFRGVYPSLCNSSSFVFRLPPYKPSREMMAAIS